MGKYATVPLLFVTALCAGVVGAHNFSDPAPQPRSKIALDEEPDRWVRIPDDEIAPEELVAITSESGDVKDWGHEFLNVPEVWKTTRGKGVTVAVLDTGCDKDHRDLKRVKLGKDYTGSRSGPADVNGHGTHVLGVVGGEKNDVGMVGIAPECNLISIKVLGDTGSGLSSWIAAGIDEAVASGADVISMSLGSDAPDARIKAAVDRALAKGVIVVAAAGNSGPRENTVGWPGAFPGVVCVAAVDREGKIANFSSRGRTVVVAAPGVAIRSAYPGDRFATMSGTSMATPYVAGCAALYVSACRASGFSPKPEDFLAALAETSKDAGPTGRDTAYGFGFLQPVKLLPVKKDEPKPPPTDPPPPTPGVDRIEIVMPGMTFNGRKVTKVVLELEKP